MAELDLATQNIPLFTDELPEGIIDEENIIEPIDMDGISDDAVKDAEAMVANISNLYYNDDFMKANPNLKKRIDQELESLRVLIKMRKADEVTHDILIKAISGNSGNASLYRALSDMQKTILQITTKMEETIKGLNFLLKNYQLEFNFKEYETDDQDSDEKDTHKQDSNTYRGSKQFIEDMKNLND